MSPDEVKRSSLRPPLHSRLLYWFCKNLVFVFLKIVWRMKVSGLQNVPREGGVIIAANHRSLADPPVVGSAMDRSVHFMAKEELFRFRPFGWLISNLNAHPLRRSGDIAAFKLAFSLLKSGHVVILFPEGRRSKSDNLAPGKAGVGLLSMSTGCPIIPVYIHNTGYFSKFRKISVQFGELLRPAAFSDNQAMANEVMRRIQSMKDRK